MERKKWLQKVRDQTEALYDHLAPAYWVKFGFYDNATHCQHIDKFLARLGTHGSILDAACGAGRYDEPLVKAGHEVLGVDQSANLLTKAREIFPPEKYPHLVYRKMGLQEMDFHEKFDGILCIDALEHIFPEDWPGIASNFCRALKPGGLLYATVEMADEEEVRQSYTRAKQLGLPVVPGEMADAIEEAYLQAMALDWQTITGKQAGAAAYHFYPSQEQVHTWLSQAGFIIEEVGYGDDYAHYFVRKPN